MGGGGSYYDRDTTDGYTRTTRGFSAAAEQIMSKSELDPGLVPMGRTITSLARSPVVYTFDVTGSVDNLPKIITDKMPLISGQIAQNCYLDDPELALGAIGDVECDRGPLQIGDFGKLREADAWLKRIWCERMGGNNQVEGYEFMAYYLSRYCKMPNAVTPFCLMTGDEGVRPELSGELLEKHFGGSQETIPTKRVFADLRKAFKDNVFLIHRYYKGGDAESLATWRDAGFPSDHIIKLGNDQSIGDLTLGLLAIMTGSRTLDEFCEDMVTTRDKAQSDDRIAEIRTALSLIPALAPARNRVKGKGKADAKPSKPGKKNKKYRV